jgi:hypothetical protein
MQDLVLLRNLPDILFMSIHLGHYDVGYGVHVVLLNFDTPRRLS